MVPTNPPGFRCGARMPERATLTPHRLKFYIKAGPHPRDECLFCVAPSMSDESAHRGTRKDLLAALRLNLFPTTLGQPVGVFPLSHTSRH
jgi:ATP adenylyltransferase